MVLADFINNNLKGQLDNGQGTYLGECVSLAIRVAHDVYNVPYGTLYCSKTGGARDLFEQYDGRIPQYFDRIVNNPNDYNQLPQAGDLIIWGDYMGRYGHVGVVVQGSPLLVYQQLGTPVFKKPEIKQYSSYAGVLGWLRPKNQQQGGVTVAIIQDAENWYARCNRTHVLIRNEQLDRNIFKGYVGKDFLAFVEAVEDDPVADQVQKWQETGEVATRDNWPGQIYGLQDQLKATNETLAKVQEQANLSTKLSSEVDRLTKQNAELAAKNVSYENSQQAANATGNAFVQWIGQLFNSIKK